jgi:hypothetical protein
MRALDEGAYCSFPLAYTDGGALPDDFEARAELAAADRLEEAYADLRLENDHQPDEDYYATAYRNPAQKLAHRPPIQPMGSVDTVFSSPENALRRSDISMRQ